MSPLPGALPLDQPLTLSGLPEGCDALVLGGLAEQALARGRALLHVATDDKRAETLRRAFAFFAPEAEVLVFPAWDCLPYDRAGPRPEILAERMACLHAIATREMGKPRIVLATLNAALQRVPPKAWIAGEGLAVKAGAKLAPEALTAFLVRHGYARAEQAMEPGDFAVRGGLVDVFPPGTAEPFRVDFFGEDVESIRTFDPLSQRTSGKREAFSPLPVREFTLDADSIARFRKGYLEAFGPPREEDPLYTAIGEGRPHAGADHWLALFHERLETLFAFAGDVVLTLDHQVDEVARERLQDVNDYFLARKESLAHPDQWSAPYQPLSPERLYLTAPEWAAALKERTPKIVTPFTLPEKESVVAFGAEAGRTFLPERETKTLNVFEALRDHIKTLKNNKKSVLVSGATEASLARLKDILTDHHIEGLTPVASFEEAAKLGAGEIGITVLALEAGFVAGGFALITEADILGDRLPRRALRRRAENFLREASRLNPGDLVVHVQHGIGRFTRLEAVAVGEARHDCLRLEYQGGDRLYLPVENIDTLSRYGEETAEHLLDKLGGSAWQNRHARLKKRIREMADALIRIAAARATKEGALITPPEGLYDEFAARFPFTETDDQLRAIEDVFADLNKGRPMDRLICGDVGFGKTEVALRAAFAAVMAGFQAAVVAPTTLLSRQHLNTFRARFRGLPVVIEELSRLVPARAAQKTRESLKAGKVDIVIGTHALLSDAVRFARLGLLIVDEEQHFGVGHKERLKGLKEDVHVLTLSATPIPRTLQMALSGLRDMSLIATPPVDRLAVRTYVSPFDPVVIREALLREHFRGGQTYFVAPRIADLPEVAEFLKTHVPEVKFAVAHGQVPARRIEDAMTAFYEGTFDVLVSTSIIESGLDIANANTLIVHRADRFGLAQLYQLRGRVGRSKVRAYAYLTYPPRKPLQGSAEQRLHVLQSLDTLGAGFTLAAHDMDIRGAGNLLGEEQSGHIKEVGVELYQKMLEEAVREKREGKARDDGGWSPQITIAASVLIPDGYVADLGLRLSLYRRLAGLKTRDEIEAFADELHDRFGPLPEEVKHLLAVSEIKVALKEAGIEKVEAGPKGVIVSFRNNQFKNPQGLAEYLMSQAASAKLRPDHRLVVAASWGTTAEALKGLASLAENFASLARG
jgi:transcription-repair coupling factor (superfamily II helicase)